VANSQDDAVSRHPDLLAAVVLHTLVSEGRDGMTLARVAVACERDPNDPVEIQEIESALEILLEDELARRDGGRQLFAPTRAAVRACELTF
jgi:hypothetical protein